MPTGFIAASIFAGAIAFEQAGLWQDFKIQHNKTYSFGEEAVRHAAFVQNMDNIVAVQQANPFASFGPNRFSDMTEEEFEQLRNHAYEEEIKTPCPGLSANCCELPDEFGVQTLVDQWDWRSKGAVTPVKDQGRCGSCWAFATCGTIEGQWAAAGGNLTDVSVQQLVSCESDDLGCSGGRVDTALRWIHRERNGNAEADLSYPYTAGSGTATPCADKSCWALQPTVTDDWCTSNCMGTPPNCPASLCSCDGTNPHEQVAAKVAGCKDLPKDEDQMAAILVQKGPFAVAINADTWTSYKGGIMTDCPAGRVSHGVTVVGFGSEEVNGNLTKYWIIKNSWAESWGEGGYIRLGFGANLCSITYRPVMAIVDAPQSISV